MILIIIAAVLFCSFTAAGKNSMAHRTDDTDARTEMKKDRYCLQISDEEDEFVIENFNNDIKDIKELVRQSDCILVCETTKERINCDSGIFSRVKAVQVIKGSNYLKNGSAVVCEPCNFEYSRYYYVYGGYNAMRPDTRYLLFLKKIDSAYSQFFDTPVLTPVSTFYAKYRVDGQAVKAVPLDEKAVDNEKVSYARIRDYELLTSDRAKIEKYEELYGKAGMVIRREKAEKKSTGR